MTRSVFSAASVLAAALLLAACGSKVPLNEVPVETRNPAAGAGSGQTAGGAGAGAGQVPQSQVATVRVGGDDLVAAALAAGRTVYFDYDSFVVRDDGKPVVDAHSKALVANRTRKLVIEGHTDERGGREYNLALGQKRAQAVVQAMKLLGVNDAQLEAVSYGEERPAVQGADEAAYAKNRRVELRDAK
jgi:peptidoglycan-associated lipoprotein